MAEDKDFYIGILPKPPQASEELMHILADKFRAFRLQALKELDGKALGRSEYAYESTRPRDLYYQDLTGSRDFWKACFVAPAGLDGNNLRNVTKNPKAHHEPYPAVNEDDERIIREGRWIGMSSTHGPFSKDEWQLKHLPGPLYPDEVESRFHLANLYFDQEYRKNSDGDGTKLFTRLARSSFDYFERFAYLRAKKKPAYLRLRGTVAPTTPGTKLMDIYESFGYHIVGYVPQVTAMLVNGAKVGSWPSVDENRGFYADCLFPTFEKLCRIDEDGVSVLTHTSPSRESWSKL